MENEIINLMIFLISHLPPKKKDKKKVYVVVFVILNKLLEILIKNAMN